LNSSSDKNNSFSPLKSNIIKFYLNFKMLKIY
jgi:hypothetical protein